MKHITSKIPAMIGLFFSAFSFIWVISSFMELDPILPGGNSPFALWVISVINAFFAMLFYFVDAIISVIKAFKGENRALNIILASAVAVGVPMVVFVGGGLGINILIWNLYHAGLVALEIILLLKSLRLAKDSLATNEDGYIDKGNPYVERFREKVSSALNRNNI